MSPSTGQGLVEGAVIVIVDKDDGDARFVESMLVEVFGTDVPVHRARTQADTLELLAVDPEACVVLDLGLDGHGDETLALLIATAPNAAVVVLTSEEHAAAGNAAVAAGAQDFLVKGRASSETIGRAVRYALVRKRTELGVARASSHLKSLVDSSSDAIFSRDLDGLVTSWNTGATRMFGYAADEIIGQSVSTLIPAGLSSTLAGLLTSARRGDRKEVETQRVRKDGVVLDVWISYAPLRDANGVIVGASTVCRNMSEHNHVEAERRYVSERQQQSERLEGLGQLASGIAHDFGNLLSIILNYAEFVLADTADMPQTRSDAQQIQVAANSALQLTQHLLGFARNESVVPVPLELNTVVRRIETMLSRTIGDHIELIVTSTPTERTIAGDRNEIEQVIMNLAINARDAMPDGGVLTIDTGPSDLDAAFADLHFGVRPGPFVELTVTDTGSGMSTTVFDDIFKPFFTTKPGGQGTGLGLATVNRIVTEAGGLIDVDSRIGAGTTFRIYFPALEVPAA